jgi:flagellum-specific ATP synthase
VGFTGERLLLMPFEEVHDVGAGSVVEVVGGQMTVPVADQMLGRILDGLGQPIDGMAPITAEAHYPVNADPPPALSRRKISQPLPLGVRALDALITCGVGQRMGIFAGPGVGKSSLLGMIARNTTADINVIALIGERGREVGEFVERDLGPEGLKRSVVVCATSDQPPVLRMRGAQVATAIAEFFRDRGHNVLLMMDSVTRFAWAQREVGLATGEPPTRNGYTPSVFAALPRLLERAGNSATGSITALYTVLVEGDDMDDPVASTVRATLDGHIILSRRLASLGHYPAVDVLESVSRVMPQICDDTHRTMAREVRAAMAAYRESEDLINLGAYVAGTNPRVDRAVTLKEPIDILLRQAEYEPSGLEDTRAAMEEILSIPQPIADPRQAVAGKLQMQESAGVQPAAAGRPQAQFSSLG